MSGVLFWAQTNIEKSEFTTFFSKFVGQKNTLAIVSTTSFLSRATFFYQKRFCENYATFETVIGLPTILSSKCRANNCQPQETPIKKTV